MAYGTRTLWSPVPRLIVAGLVVATAAVAANRLARAHRKAPGALALAGLTLTGTFLALQELFPLVHASSEPPSLLERYWYPSSLFLIIFFTIAGVSAAKRLRSV